MALNHTDDEIQLGDLIRFFREGHLTFQNITSESSENEINKILFKNQISRSDGAFPSHKALRQISLLLKKEIGFEFKIPDMRALCKRYVDELCLPPDICKMVDVLFNDCPPQFGLNVKKQIQKVPNFEGRAMASIIFILKLLFGLDDKREHLISSSSSALNTIICEKDSTRQKLFVWNDWVEYIETRHSILIQCHYPTAFKFNPYSDSMTHLYVDYLLQQKEKGLFNAKWRHWVPIQYKGIPTIFEDIIKLHATENTIRSRSFNQAFEASLTPKRSYMEELLRCPSDIFIPKFMKIEHNQRDIQSFLESTNLKSFFDQHQIKLVTNKLEGNKNITFMGLFKNPPSIQNTYDRYNFDISTKEWLQNLKKLEINAAKEKKPDLEPIKVAGEKNLMKIKQNNRKGKEKNKHRKTKCQPRISISNNNGNMPASDMETDDDEYEENNIAPLERVSLSISNFDYWMQLSNLENVTLENFVSVRKKLPKTFQWLLQKCADLTESDELELYNQLIIIEYYLAHCKPFSKMTDGVKSVNKDINSLLSMY